MVFHKFDVALQENGVINDFLNSDVSLKVLAGIKYFTLIEHTDHYGYTVAHIAAQMGKVSHLSFLLAASPNLATKQNSLGQTPLYISLLLGQFKIAEWLLQHYPECATIRNGLRGDLPLQIAMRNLFCPPRIIDALENLMQSPVMPLLVDHEHVPNRE